MKKLDDARQQIIDAVIGLAGSSGIDGLTTKKLAKHAGFAEGTIYRYFQSKEELLIEAYLAVITEIDTEIGNAFEGDDTISMMRVAWNAYLDFLLAHPTKLAFVDQFRHDTLHDSREYYLAKIAKGFVALNNVETYFNVMKQNKLSAEILIAIVIEATNVLALQSVKKQVTFGADFREKVFSMLIRSLA